MSKIPRIFAIVFVACSLLSGVSFAFQTPPWAGSYSRQLKAGPASRHETALQMGLRSFLKSKVLKREEDANGSKPVQDVESTKQIKAKKKKKSKEIKTVTSDDVSREVTSKEVAFASDEPEPKVFTDTGEEISVVAKKEHKLPPLQRETVKDRVNRVRSGKMTADEKQAFLRTALSAKDTATSRAPLRQAIPDGSSKNGANSTGNASPFPKDSFQGIFAAGQKVSNNTDTGDVPVRNWKDGLHLQDQKKKREYLDMVTDPNRFHTYKSSVVTSPGEAEIDPSVHGGVVQPQVEDVEQIIEEDVSEDKSSVSASEDLATRLSKAAHAQEEANRRKEQARMKEAERLQEERLSQKRRMESIQEQQHREQEKRELELKARKREQEERMRQETEKRKKEEMVRQRKLMQEQDAYWAKKLAKEREARMEGMSQKQKEEFVKQEALEAQKKAELAQEESMESMEEEPPAIVDLSDKSVEAFSVEQRRKKAERAKAEDEQIARLKALNSPFPSPAPRPDPKVPPIGATRGASELSNLMNPPKPAPPVVSPPPEPSIAELTKEVKVNKQEKFVGEEPEKKGVLSGIFGGGKKKEEQSPVKNEGKTKRVVRQELPLGDDEDDFDTFTRNGPNQHVSIADAMKSAGESVPEGDQEQRSKMWGVDMSRIAKSLEDEKKGGK